MKVLDVALKDMLQSSRSYFALVFMFGIPILITGLFFFMFGGLRDEVELIGIDEPGDLRQALVRASSVTGQIRTEAATRGR